MSGIRITAGTLRGRRIHLPSGPVRPTSSRAREAVFNILSESIPGSRFLDLFAGSGIMSLEALSRGAREAVAVENSGKAVTALASVAHQLDLPLVTRRMDVLRFLRSTEQGEAFDVVYADPPYDYADYHALLQAIDRDLPLGTDAVVAIEHRKKVDPLAGAVLERLTHQKGRSWGQVSVEFYRATGSRNIATEP